MGRRLQAPAEVYLTANSLALGTTQRALWYFAVKSHRQGMSDAGVGV